MGRKLIAGNWKMNGLRGPGLTLAGELARRAAEPGKLGCELLICPPAPLLCLLADALRGSGVALGGQDCHSARSGAHTGDLSAEMLKDAGCAYVIVGHSERRADHGESDALVKAKAEAAIAAGLVPIVCIGETAEQRAAGQTLAVVGRQLEGSLPGGAAPQDLPRDVVVAYEPVWAIGTGQSATAADVSQVHGQIRSLLTKRFGAAGGGRVRLLYGGSVKPDNAGVLLRADHVNGALVGGASLSAEDFWAIGAAYP